jgi:hypothetical protein
MGHSHWMTRRRMARLFTGPPAPDSHRALLAELGSCPSCAARYRRYHELEAALCGVPAGPSPFALERLEALALDAAAPPGPRRGLRAWSLASAAGVAAVAALVLALKLWPAGPEHVALGGAPRLEDVTLTARGGPPGASEVGVRLLRAVAPGRVTEAAGLSRQDVITFTYTNVRPGIRYLALFGVQEDGRVRWYYPGYGAHASIPIPGDVIDEPLGDGIRLAVHHRDGWLRVTAVFSPEPIDTRTLERAVQELAGRPEALRRLEPLGLASAAALEHSVLTAIARQSKE